MASYFDEHNCEPLGEGETPNHMLHLARLLLDTGLSAEWQMEYDRIFGGERKIPRASKKAIEELQTQLVSPTVTGEGHKCPVCLVEFEEEEEMKVLPCQHQFHTKCILTWLEKVCSCPVCRFELPTDDPDYETYKKHKTRSRQRQHDLDSLHDSMFG